MDFLNKIPETVDLNTFLVTIDVKSLNTNIPHDFAIEAIANTRSLSQKTSLKNL
jgi:hypothetical protein